MVFGTCCTFSARRSVKLRLHEFVLLLGAGVGSLAFFVEDCCSCCFGFTVGNGRSQACILLLLRLLVMFDKLLGLRAWREWSGREVLVLWCGGRGGGSML